MENSLLSQWRMEQERLDMMENLAHDIKTPLAIAERDQSSIEHQNRRD
ncbi:hypothetical protein [Paenibacillus sp. CAU 1782]